MFNKTRKDKIKEFLQFKLNGKLNSDDINNVIKAFETYQKDNLDTITKLKRIKSYESKRISGALKQTINAHGPITKEFIGSATKRVYGSLLDYRNNNVKMIIKYILIGFWLSSLMFLVGLFVYLN